MTFRFLDSGPLVDRELELVEPAEKWIEPTLLACAHQLSRGDERSERTTRQSLLDLIKVAPRGRHEGDTIRVPGYTFWMHLLPQYDPPVPMAGGLSLRIGNTREIELYFGHFGYNVYPPARGNHYAERACRLLLPLARMHGLRELWITCNPDNIPSRRTCERLGAKYVETVPLPPSNVLYQRGERHKCRYLVTL
jgi:predicted acetyltransferase